MCDQNLSEETCLLNVNRDQHPSVKKRPGDHHLTRLQMYILTVGSILLIGAGVVLIDNIHFQPRRLFHLSILGSSNLKKWKPSLNSGITTAPPGCESTVLLLRHCDKPNVDDGDSHCSYVGFERSYHLATIFGERWPMPSKLYAMTIDRLGHENFRQTETLEPLSLKSGLEIHSNYTSNENKKLANEIFKDLRDGSMCGQLAVISWKHSCMHTLAIDLGWDRAPRRYHGSTFDEIWEIKYVYKPLAVLKDVEAQEDSILINNRELRSRKKKKVKQNAIGDWSIYGTITHQNFDPLEYSYISNDYPNSGKKNGGNWLNR